MNYQGVRAEFESDLATAYAALSPAVPVYFDNTLNTVSDAETEFIHVNLQFGLTTESSLSTQHDFIRGTIVVRAYSEKGKGPARNQTLINPRDEIWRKSNAGLLIGRTSAKAWPVNRSNAHVNAGIGFLGVVQCLKRGKCGID